MKYPLYSSVILTRNLPQYGFKKGDVATIVEYIENSPENGYILEFFDANGDTLSVVPVLETDITKPYPKAIINYRRLTKNV
jgi:hypothetical protein